MKKIPFLILLIAAFAVKSPVGFAQTGIINTIAGGGSLVPNGVPAINATLTRPVGIAADGKGNYYIYPSFAASIYKVSASGIISQFAGNGTGSYSGDGGPATAAGLSLYPYKGGIAADRNGNVYIYDFTSRIRKINAAGVITTIAGNGTYGYSGDGGPATSAKIEPSGALAVDNAGNLYIGNYSIIRKVSTSGIITTVAGTYAMPGFAGDGGPATNAKFDNATDVACDNSGNIYVADSGNGRIRKVDAYGIITTVAGSSHIGYSGDGGLALSAGLEGPLSVCLDSAGDLFVRESLRVRRVNKHGIITTVAGNGSAGFSGDGQPGPYAKLNTDMCSNILVAGDKLYIADVGNNRIRQVSLIPQYMADSFGVDVYTECAGFKFNIQTQTYFPAYNVKTFYGDGTFDSSNFSNLSGKGYTVVNHSYPASGTYTIKHILRSGLAPFDSVSYPHKYSFCNELPVVFYYDVLQNCSYSSASDPLSSFPTLAEIDSNGIPVDTVSVTSGFNYSAYGNAGDVYRIKVLDAPAAMPNICPSSGVHLDTLRSGSNVASTKYFGFACNAVPDFDLEVNAIIPFTGINEQWGNIYVKNTSCHPLNSTVSLHFSPQYIYWSGHPTPATVSGNTVTWNLNSFSTIPDQPIGLYYVLILNPSTGPLTANDTVQSSVYVTPTTGDIRPANNAMIIIDTVSASNDPNEIWVTPQGNITAGTQLKYTINFENTGNDTAYNIYLMDTLSDFVDPSSLRLLFASHAMNITKVYDNICHNIVRFDFPNINLLDSSHHGLCDGAVSFTINTKPGLPVGSAIFNQAGIYFDNNPVVMTNTVEDIIWKDSSTTVRNQYKNISGPAVLIYPNPANDELNIKADKDAYNSFTITNNIGQVLMQQPLYAAQSKVDVKGFAPGLYFIALRGAEGVKVEKFVKR
jgi:uncharacterized repeat protein (TIGR01451 family)